MSDPSGLPDTPLPPTERLGSPAPPATAGLGIRPGTGGFGSGLSPSIPRQDLTRDALISNAPRIEIESRPVPALGGIPLLAKLGQGGMGAVYYGIHPRLDVEIAIKVLPFHLAERDPAMVERFFREAKIAARVKSPHLIGVTDVNQENGLIYLLMEFVQGVSAGGHLRRVKERGATGLPEIEALDICIAATTGLVTAHEHGIIHRDIKPDNIMIPLRRGSEELNFAASKLADLGLARSDEGNQTMTGSGACMGTPGFMAPEQAEDARHAGTPADVFSMGATLYALLAGTAPFTGTALIKVLRATFESPHAPIRSIRADVSEATAALLDRCLSKNPGLRYRDAPALQAALKDCRASREPAATVVPTTPAPAPAPVPTAASVAPPPVATPKRKEPARTAVRRADVRAATPVPRKRSVGVWIALIALAALLMLAVAGGALWYFVIRKDALLTAENNSASTPSEKKSTPKTPPKVEPSTTEKAKVDIPNPAEGPSIIAPGEVIIDLPPIAPKNDAAGKLSPIFDERLMGALVKQIETDLPDVLAGQERKSIRVDDETGQMLRKLAIDAKASEKAPEMPFLFLSRTPEGRRQMVALHGGSDATEQSVDAALRWLTLHQEADGHWDSMKYGAIKRSDTVCTALAVLALLGAGHSERFGAYKNNVRRAVAWLRSKQEESGRIFSADDDRFDSRGEVEAIALLALVEATGMGSVRETREAAQQGITYFTDIHRDGVRAWGAVAKSESTLQVTGWVVLALKAAKMTGLNVNNTSFDGAILFLDSVSQPVRGAKQSDFAPIVQYLPQRNSNRNDRPHRLSAIGLLCRTSMGWKASDVQPSVNWFVKGAGEPEWGAKGEKGDPLYWYFGTRGVFLQGGDLWRRWNEELMETLVNNQGTAGDDAGSWAVPEEARLPWGRVGMTSLSAMCLEVYYAYPKN